jgi:competence protein ComEC
MTLLRKYTRFRAYQLGTEGSSFSYFDGSHFTLIEARLSELSRASVEEEIASCGVNHINCLHITSWDNDHCSPSELETIMEVYRPTVIEYPGYEPHTETAKEALKKILSYKKNRPKATLRKVDPSYINSLDEAEQLGYKNVFYHPKSLYDDSNNNSSVKFFRTGSFNVASLGDVEDTNISARLARSRMFSQELDILILAHHGADNGFITSTFLKKTKPTVAIASSNYDNKYEHPKQEIRNLLFEHDIPLFTTKTGDIIIESVQPHTHIYKVFNLISNSAKISSIKTFKSRKSKFLSYNADSIRNHFNKHTPFYKKFK